MSGPSSAAASQGGFGIRPGDNQRAPFYHEASRNLPGFDSLRRMRERLAPLLSGDLTRKRPIADYQKHGNVVATGTPDTQIDRTFTRTITGGRGRYGRPIPSNQGGTIGVLPRIPGVGVDILADQGCDWVTTRPDGLGTTVGQLCGATMRPAARDFCNLQRTPRTWQREKIRGDQERFKGVESTMGSSPEDLSLNAGPLPNRIPMPRWRSITALAGPGDISGYGVWAAPFPGTRSGTLVLRPVNPYFGRFRGVKAISGVLAPGVQNNELSHIPAVFTPRQVG